MHDVPECLNRRYRALDDLVSELSSGLTNRNSDEECTVGSSDDAGVRLMCDFWNILKEDPDVNLTQAVRKRMGLATKTSHVFRPQNITCYMACKKCGASGSEDRKSQSPGEASPRGQGPKGQASSSKPKPGAKSPEPVVAKACCSSKSVSPKSTNEGIPLSKVLCNLKEAVSFDKKCNLRISELMMAEKQLQDQIQHLEHKEKEGIAMLKQADCMWSCMEEAYKNKVAESIERQNALYKQMKEIDASNSKWRKNKKDLEFQLANISKCHCEIKEKINEKKNDVNCIKMEIETFKKRIEGNKKETDAAKKSLYNKKTASDARIAKLVGDIKVIKAVITEEQTKKRETDREGSEYVKEAREELQKISKVLLKKRLEKEDLKAERETIIEDIELLKKTCVRCKEKCANKQQSLIDEIKKIDSEIAGFRVQCIRCHQCTDTGDTRKFCVDCPRCVEQRECMTADGYCELDPTMDCVCMATKQKFLDNVFENMYNILERKTKTPNGKCVASAVLNCLEKSRNGKLNEETRKILQEFVLSTVKKNLNLTIIGGAVKTRCEMDPETYNKLMLCLNEVKAAAVPKADKGTIPKKDPCRRWGSTSECNCPRGPKACICTKKAPPPAQDPEPCPELDQDPEDPGEVQVCPHKKPQVCGVDCGMRATPSAVGTEVASWRPAPCDERQCFSKNMRAAQCVLGPESLSSVMRTKGKNSASSFIHDASTLDEQITCKCGITPNKPCICRKELKSHPRERIIEEVMGRYNDVMPIEKVAPVGENDNAESNTGKNKSRCACSNKSFKELMKSCTSISSDSKLCICSSSYKIGDLKPYQEKLKRSKLLYICRKSKDFCAPKDDIYKLFPSFKFQCSKAFVIGSKGSKKIAMLRCPMVGSFTVKDEFVGSSGIATSFAESTLSDYETPSQISDSSHEAKEKQSIQSSEKSLYRRIIGDTVKNLLKEVVVFDNSKHFCSQSSDVEWITVESFLKEIVSLTKSGSNITANEIELSNEIINDKTIQMPNKETQINVIMNPKSNYNANIYSASINDGFMKIKNENNILINSSKRKLRKQCKSYCFRNKNAKQLKVDDESTGSSIQKKTHETVKSNIFYHKVKQVPSFKSKTNNNDEVYKSKNNIKKVKHQIDSQIIKSHVNKETSNSNTKNTEEIHTMTVFTEHKDVSSENNTENEIQAKTNFENEHFLISITDNDGHAKKQFTRLIKSPSGGLAMELDDKILKLIKHKSDENFNVSVYLKQTDSGHKIVNFSPSENAMKNTQKIEVNKSPSGNLLFEVDKTFIDTLQPNFIDKTPVAVINTIPSFSIKVKPDKFKSVETGNIQSDLNTKSVESEQSHGKSIVLKIIRNKHTHRIPAYLTKSVSGNIFIFFDNVSTISAKVTNIDGIPVTLEKSDSNSYILDFKSMPNATLKKNMSGRLVIEMNYQLPPTNTKLHEIQDQGIINAKKKPKEMFEISIKDSANDFFIPPAVLNTTPSRNYVITIDKEYEMHAKEAVKKQMTDDYECAIHLSRTDSGRYLVDLMDNDNRNVPNALLKRSMSGNLIIQFHLPESPESLRSNLTTNCKQILQLLNGVPVDPDKKMKKPLIAKAKSSSDSNLLEKGKIKLQNQQLLDPSTLLKKTPSGQYTVVLNKESKKSFINNLKSYLASNTQGLIPIKRTNSGEIIITLNKDVNSENQYGSLKITTSGNIYITVDENLVKGMSKNNNNNQSSVINKTIPNSPHESKVTKTSQNKCLTTTCNAVPDNCSCDASKCICAELLKHGLDDSGAPKFCQPHGPNCNCEEKTCEYKESVVCSENCCLKTSKQSDKMPHIVIKPCVCRHNLHKSSMSNDQNIYYVSDAESVCPFHKDRYDSVSNELLEISGLCNTRPVRKISHKEKLLDSKTTIKESCTAHDSNLDYLDFLPHQLPHFLQDFKCA